MYMHRDVDIDVDVDVDIDVDVDVDIGSGDYPHHLHRSSRYYWPPSAPCRGPGVGVGFKYISMILTGSEQSLG